MTENNTFLELVFIQKDSNSNININGVPIKQKINIPVATCHNCGYILMEFDNNISLRLKLNYLNTNLKQNINYCPGCGSKINYSNCEIIDAKISEPDKN